VNLGCPVVICSFAFLAFLEAMLNGMLFPSLVAERIKKRLALTCFLCHKSRGLITEVFPLLPKLVLFMLRPFRLLPYEGKNCHSFRHSEKNLKKSGYATPLSRHRLNWIRDRDDDMKNKNEEEVL